MENFLDHMAFVCLSGAIIGGVLGTWCFIGEKILEKFNLTEKFVEFMFNSNEEED